MIITHNLLAQEAQRYYGINGKSRAKTIEKLSSGYKINRSADDAAGLSISEKMRLQIRGLKQGTDNIQDGISLVQVADGALDEIVDNLQRINELSIKAYNGTNSKKDREYCQDEVDRLLSEIERTAETTTFNELRVLQGNPKVKSVEKVVISEEYEVTQMVRYSNVEMKIPEWLSVDDELALHPDRYTDKKQDTSGVMPVDRGDEHIYYGPEDSTDPKIQGREHKGEWTDGMADNFTAEIDFSGLKKSQSLDELYNNLTDLIGCSIGIPCGTCNDIFYGICFTGELPGFSAIARSYPHYGEERLPNTELNLTAQKFIEDDEGNFYTCFEYISKIQQEMQGAPDMSEEEKEKKVAETADKIAKALCRTAYELMAQDLNNKDHYDKSFLSDDGYSIIVYDYRDYDKVEFTSDVTVQNTVYADFWVEESYTVPAVVEYREVEKIGDLNIVCSSSGANDMIPIYLPQISLKRLGLSGYNVALYLEQTLYEYAESYEEYKKRHDEWEKSAVYKEYKEERTIEVRDLQGMNIHFDEHGELRHTPVFGPPYEKTVTVTYSKKEYPYDEPVRRISDATVSEVYSPSDLQIISDALDYVSQARSYLGAVQNRLEHAYDNNNNKHENTTASESGIRDADIVKEAVENSRSSILQQVGEAIMAQANQSKQGVIRFLE